MMIRMLFSLLTVFILEGTTTDGTLCPPDLKNLAVYKGDKNTLIESTADPNSMLRWKIFPTSDDQDFFSITDYDGENMYINPTFTGLFYLNQSGLVVLEATTTAGDGPISTAGIYQADCKNDGGYSAAKLVVVLNPPECSCDDNSPGEVRLSCNISYADYWYNPIVANMTWKVGGVVFNTETPTRTESDGEDGNDVWVSTSTITVDNSVAADYECVVTFTAPTINPSDYPVSTTAPKFRASCSGSACRVTTKYVETTTTPLPTTTTTTIPSTTTTTIATGPSTTPAGSGHKCSCSPIILLIKYKLSCSVNFTDSSTPPRPAKITWSINGMYYTKDSSPTIQKKQNMSTASSTITVTRILGLLGFSYRCTLTFDNDASNEPEFGESCSGFCPVL